MVKFQMFTRSQNVKIVALRTENPSYGGIERIVTLPRQKAKDPG